MFKLDDYERSQVRARKFGGPQELPALAHAWEQQDLDRQAQYSQVYLNQYQGSWEPPYNTELMKERLLVVDKVDKWLGEMDIDELVEHISHPALGRLASLMLEEKTK